MDARLHPDVLAAARSGAGWAFEHVFRSLSPAVHGYLRAQGAADPAGSVNEVFLRVHRRLSTFDGDVGAFRSWVFVIAHNLLLDERRWLRRRPPEDVVAAAPEPPPHPEDTGDLAVDRVNEARLVALLHTLSPEQRDVLLLRFVADLSLEQAAAATGRSLVAVKALQRRALDALRRRLHEVHEISGEPVSRFARVALTEA